MRRESLISSQLLLRSVRRFYALFDISFLTNDSQNIANTLAPLKTNRNFIIFGGLLGEIDFALKSLLFQVGFLVDGVLVLLSGL